MYTESHLDWVAEGDAHAHPAPQAAHLTEHLSALHQASLEAFDGGGAPLNNPTSIKQAVHLAAVRTLLERGCTPDEMRGLDAHFREAERRLMLGACCHGAMAGSSHVEEARLAGIRGAISEQLQAQADTTLTIGASLPKL